MKRILEIIAFFRSIKIYSGKCFCANCGKINRWATIDGLTYVGNCKLCKYPFYVKKDNKAPTTEFDQNRMNDSIKVYEEFNKSIGL